MVELSDWDKKKQVEGEENVAKNDKIAMQNLKNRVDNLNKNVICSNSSVFPEGDPLIRCPNLRTRGLGSVLQS